MAHVRRSETVESAGDSRPADRSEAQAYSLYAEAERREQVAKIWCYRPSQRAWVEALPR